MILWWDWLLSPTPELKRRGLNPAERVNHTGHRRPMTPAWANTIGMWCRTDAADVMHRISPNDTNDKMKMKTRQRYDVFRYRHHLLLRREFMERHEMDPNAFIEIGPVVVATDAYLRMTDHLRRSPGLSPGAAAENASIYLASEMKKPPSERTLDKFGLLPIEMYLYYHAILHIFEQTAIDHDQWVEGGGSPERWKDRARYWKQFEGNSLVRLPRAALARYSLDHAQDDEA